MKAKRLQTTPQDRIDNLINIAQDMSEADGRVRYVGVHLGTLAIWREKPSEKNFFKVVGRDAYLMVKGQQPVPV